MVVRWGGMSSESTTYRSTAVPGGDIDSCSGFFFFPGGFFDEVVSALARMAADDSATNVLVIWMARLPDPLSIMLFIEEETEVDETIFGTNPCRSLGLDLQE